MNADIKNLIENYNLTIARLEKSLTFDLNKETQIATNARLEQLKQTVSDLQFIIETNYEPIS